MAKKPTKKSIKNEIAVAPSSIEDSVRVKKISNGYLITKSSYSKNGGYSDKEIYSKTKPTIKF